MPDGRSWSCTPCLTKSHFETSPYYDARTTYTDPLGKQRTWESAERSTRPKNSPIDGVGIVAILQKPSGPELLLQKQFRPPINKVVIEVPAGLVDEGESAEESAVRELREETGYVGVAAEISPIMFNGESSSSFSQLYSGKIVITRVVSRPWILQYKFEHGPRQRRYVAKWKPKS